MANDTNWTASDELRRLQGRSTKVTEESVAKTRDMLRLVNECRDAGVNTLNSLYEQGEQLNRTEVALHETGETLDVAHIRIRNMEKASNVPCCCLPCVSLFQKDPDKKRKCKCRKKENLKAKKGAEKGDEMSTVLPPRNMDGSGDREERFFPKIMETKEEDEIESNLSKVSEHLGELKGVALNMNTEVNKQNEQLDRLNDKTEENNIKIDAAKSQTTDLVSGKKRSKTCWCCSLC